VNTGSIDEKRFSPPKHGGGAHRDTTAATNDTTADGIWLQGP
jgi:hypothetical protein